MSKSVDIRQRRNKSRQFGGMSSRGLRGRMSQSYTDINTQISDQSTPGLSMDAQTRSIDRRTLKQSSQKSSLDYAFLRELLGINLRGGGRATSNHEGFVSDELKEAVMKLRQEVKDLKLEIKDKNWLKTLEDLGDLNDMDKDFLESLYMLRNAYKKGVFSSTQTVNDIDLGLILGGHTFSQSKDKYEKLAPINLNHNRSHSSSSTVRSLSPDSLSDVESTTSSVMIKKRPAKPRIHLSSASFSDLAAREDESFSAKGDGTVMLSEMRIAPRKESLVQQADLNQMPDRPDSAESSTSYLNLAEENAGSKYLSDDNNDLSPTIENSKKLSYVEFKPVKSKTNDSKIYTGFRSDSPTSKLLEPIFRHPMSEEIFNLLGNIRAEISPKFSRLDRLENENKLLAVLQVKLAVLQEEKRQLLNTLKQRRSARQSMSSSHSSKTSSPLSSPVSFQSEAEEAYIIRPSPHRAKTSKSVQTGDLGVLLRPDICPLCQMARRDSPMETVRRNHNGNDLVKNQLAPKSDAITKEELVMCDAESCTTNPLLVDSGVGDMLVCRDTSDASTETVAKLTKDSAVGSGLVEKALSSASTQCLVERTDRSSQHDRISYENKSVAVGCSCFDYSDFAIQCSPSYKDASFGDDIAVRTYVDSSVQKCITLCDKTVGCDVLTSDKGQMFGCGLRDCPSVGLQTSILTSDFTCGEGPAVIESIDNICQATVNQNSVGLSPVEWEKFDSQSQCNLGVKESRTLGLGDCSTEDVLCDKCLNTTHVPIGIGAYNPGAKTSDVENDNLCRINDKLCECSKPEARDVGAGDSSVDIVVCDSCSNRQFRTVACSDDRTDALLCDTCGNLQIESRGCGDSDVNVVVCDECSRVKQMEDTGVGNADVFEVVCDSCQNSADVSDYINVSILDNEIEDVSSRPLSGHEENGTSDNPNHNEDERDRIRLTSVSSETEFCEEVYKIMANSAVYDRAEQHPVICNYCGNKVDLNDKEMDSALIEMRNNLGSYGRHGLATSHGVDNLSGFVDVDEGENDADEVTYSGESADEEDYNDSIKSDVVESCKMLQLHLSGEKPIKQQLMLKHLANIENFWFQTVKKKRANAAIVKSYIDLFQGRIPELLDTIINLMDQDGNTALHYALTYRNIGVVSILLDSQECSVDLVNKAGYSPVMLAALAGFENKTDKYVMQRLIRAGDVNAKNKETGQTPLMLAVSRGHVGMAELLLDAGADVNESDNDGSTALMCACEYGSMPLVKALLSNPDCDPTKEDHDGSTALSIAMDAKRRDLALLIYGSLNFDTRGRIKLTPSKQSLLGLGARRSPSPAVGKI